MMDMDKLILWPPTWSTLLLVPALFVGFTVHELGHAIVAYLLGDVSQVERRRLSFNPLRHVSWVGLVVFLLFGFGWAKPVQVDPRRFRVKNRAFGMFWVSLSGAAANLLTAAAVLVGMIVTVLIVWVVGGVSPMAAAEYLSLPGPGLDLQGIAAALSGNMLMVNLVLAFFNLLPLPPLDGFQAVVSLVAAIRAFRGRGTALGSDLWAPRRAEGLSRQTVRRDTGDLTAGRMANGGPALIHFRIGLDYHRAGQLEEAIARYRQATDNDDRFGLAYYNLGLAYWDMGRILQATSAFKAALACPGSALQIQASRRIRELALVPQSPGVGPGAAPPPLAVEDVQQPQTVDAHLPLGPDARRRVLRSLAAGGTGAVLLAVVAWVYVTIVTWGALVGGATLP